MYALRNSRSLISIDGLTRWVMDKRLEALIVLELIRAKVLLQIIDDIGYTTLISRCPGIEIKLTDGHRVKKVFEIHMING